MSNFQSGELVYVRLKLSVAVVGSNWKVELWLTVRKWRWIGLVDAVDG